MSDSDRDFAAISEKDIFEEARDRLELFNSLEGDNRSRAKEAIQFREGDQWPDSTTTSASEDEIELTINLTDAMCERVENNIRQQRPRGKCHPVGDGADVEIAEIINGIGRHVETRSEASVAYDTAAASALTAGFGYFRLVAEYVAPDSFQKDLRILPIRNAFTVAMDPGAIMPHGGDQMWCVISVKMKRQEYKRRYPRAENASWLSNDADDRNMDWDHREEIRLAEYFRIREKSDVLYGFRLPTGEEFTRYASDLLNPQTGKRATEDEIVAMLAQAIQQAPDKAPRLSGKRDSVKRQVEWFRLNGTKVVERQELPGTYIPVFRVEGRAADIDGKVRRRGMVEPMMDAARMVNYGEVAKIKRLGLSPKAPWIAAEGQLEGHPEWDDANIKPYSKLVYKPIVIETSQGPVMPPPPARQPPAQIEQGFSEFVQGMRSNLMSLAGMPQEPGQDANGQVVSGVALKRRQWLSDQSHFRYYENTTLAIAQCWRCILEYIPATFWEPGRVQRIIGEDSVPQMVTLNQANDDPDAEAAERVKNDLSVGKYDVVMDTGPGYETKREEGAENLIDLMKIPVLAEQVAKIGSDLVFRSIDHPYMQELADRVASATPEGLKKAMEGLSGKAKAIVQSLAGENAALKQKLQELEMDLKAGITKAHLAATVKAHEIDSKVQISRDDNSAWTAEERHDTDTRAATALAVEEIRAAGKLLDSRVVAGAKASQAERQLLHEAEQAELDRQKHERQADADDGSQSTGAQ